MKTNGFVTVYSAENRNEAPRCLGVFECWIYLRPRIKTEKGGHERSDAFDIRIPSDKDLGITPGDLIFVGEGPTEADIKKCRRAAVVVNNLYGKSPHIHIAAEYLYK